MSTWYIVQDKKQLRIHQRYAQCDTCVAKSARCHVWKNNMLENASNIVGIQTVPSKRSYNGLNLLQPAQEEVFSIVCIHGERGQSSINRSGYNNTETQQCEGKLIVGLITWDCLRSCDECFQQPRERWSNITRKHCTLVNQHFCRKNSKIFFKIIFLFWQDTFLVMLEQLQT